MVSHDIRQHDRGRSFSRIEQKRKYAEDGRFAGDVRCPYVSAAASAHILTSEYTNQQISEWNRSQQVADDGDDQERGQGYNSSQIGLIQSKSRQFRVFRAAG